MHVRELIGWGIVIYAVAYLLAGIEQIYGLSGTTLGLVLTFLNLGIVAGVAGNSIRHSNWHDLLPYVFSWLCIVATLDSLLATPLTGWSFFLEPSIWIGYGIIAVVPITVVYLRNHKATVESRL